MKSFTQTMSTPIGKLQITANDTHILSILFVDDEQAPGQTNVVTQQSVKQLEEYFNGSRQQFDLPLQAHGTEFQQQVWQALQQVPYGKTQSYADIASRIKRPKAVRAVGAANGRNPMTIVVPCHRIIGASGALTGYASGVERKAWLLRHESGDLF